MKSYLRLWPAAIVVSLVQVRPTARLSKLASAFAIITHPGYNRLVGRPQCHVGPSVVLSVCRPDRPPKWFDVLQA